MSDAPIAAIEPVTTTLHGAASVEPYAWIADPDEPGTAAYLQSERDYYEARTSCLHDLRGTLAAEMTARVPAQESSAPWESAGWRYRREAVGGSEYDQLLRRRAASEDDERVLLDLQQVHDSSGSAYTRDGTLEVSPDGRWLAWSVDLEGQELYTLRFRDLETGLDLDEVMSATYPGGAWSADSATFLYSSLDDTMRPYQVWRHALGPPTGDDVLVFEDLDDRLELELYGTRSGAWIVMSLRGRGFTEEWLVPTADVAAQPLLVRPRELGVEYHVEHAPGHGPDGGDGFVVTTDLGASEFAVMWAPLEDLGAWTVLLAEDPSVRVHGVEAFADALVLSVRQDGAETVRVLPRGGAPIEVKSEAAGGMARLGHNFDWAAGFVSVEVESFVQPAITYDVAWDGTRTERHRREQIGAGVDDYVSERHLVPRPDGVSVPVIVMRHKDTQLDGSAPCVLYGYGSYEASCDPDWGIDWWRSLPSLFDRGVVFAVGHPRGGGEMGRRWWDDGHLATKHNTFDDQAAVAEFLLDGRVSSIVSRGISAGGLLQGALYGRRPELWAGLIAEVPFVDVVTSMLDASLPLTAQEWLEWGNPNIAEEHGFLAAYSPMLNLPDVYERPPLLVTGAVHDVRVLVREPARWVARLRASDPSHGEGDDPMSPVSPRTVIFRCETGAGAHGGPSGRYAELDYEAEVSAWALRALGVA